MMLHLRILAKQCYYGSRHAHASRQLLLSPSSILAITWRQRRRIAQPILPIHRMFSAEQPPARANKASSLSSSSSKILSASQERRLQGMKERHDEILAEMGRAGKTSNQLVQELGSLTVAASLWQERQDLLDEQDSLTELAQQAADDADAEFEQECHFELARLSRKLVRLERRLVDASLPVDDDQDEDINSNAIIEVRAGTGGDEASLFAAELVDCYTKTAQTLVGQWKVEVLRQTKTDIGGVREASISVSGPPMSLPLLRTQSTDDSEESTSSDTSAMSDDDEEEDTTILLGPYGAFQFESGVHRVQRVPVNDSRIHTSACSVAVLPAAAADDNHGATELLPMSELKIETMRASGAGGQHVNTTDSAVRITHLPTKITASIQDERSQHKNKEKALRLIAARVWDVQRRQAQQERGETRSSLMGGGDRSERIRTYNFPQDRVTDHRSKETAHGIETLLVGNCTSSSSSSSSNNAAAGGGGSSLVTAFWSQLRTMHRQEKLQQLEEQEQLQQQDQKSSKS